MTMFRRCMTAVAAVLALAPVASVQAAPEVSPFEGTYAWSTPGAGFPLAVTISDGGRITGSYSNGRAKASISGRVKADGSYSFKVSETVFDQIPSPRGNGPEWVTLHYMFGGNMAFNADGNLVGTPDFGGSFVWLRQ